MFSDCYKHGKQSFNHGEANLIRKYGQQYESAYVERCLKRLQHWGFNTLGGWSIDDFSGIPESLRIPYTLNLNVTWKLPRPWINKKMMDVYDPRWEQQLEAEFAAYSKRVKDDPWLIGAFVNNELHWEQPKAFAKSLLSMEMAVPGKQRYIECLREELQTINIYMDSVLADPKCLGAHWFMMADEATAGFNGNESYNSGFLSVADQPYYEFLEQVIAYNNGLYSRF
jgi:hypothetical protein